MQDFALLLERAVGHHQAGRLSDAERDYLGSLDLDSKNADALRLLGALYVQAEKPQQAIEFFERACKADPNNVETLNNLGVALRNTGRLDDAIICYEQALAAQPDYLQARVNLGIAYYEYGNRFLPDQKYDEAWPWFERAAKTDPRNFRALNNLAGILRRKGRAGEAAKLYNDALALKPDYLEARINLGNVLRDLDRPDQAFAAYRQALAENPHSLDAWNNLGTLFQDMNRLQESIDCYDNALRIDPRSDVVRANKGFAVLALGNYAEGWALNEAGLGIKDRRGLMPFPAPTWDGRPFPNRRLLIWGEQGLGDNLQFVRYAALCKQRGGTVIVQCPETLLRIFKTCPGVDRVTAQAKADDFDHHIAMMSLPHVFGTLLETIPADVPYLSVDAATQAKWARHFSGTGKFKIGLVWAGSSREGVIDANLIDRRRSMSLSLLRPLFDLPGVQFYNLQLGKAAAQIDQFGLRERFIDPMPQVGDFLDTAALVEQLDLVISVDTAVAHLAGALAKPVWLLSRFDACWRWLQNRETNPWYPTARIFGQPKAGDWPSAVTAVREQLSGIIK